MNGEVKILVIESDADVRKTLESLLGSRPFPIEFAESPSQVRALLTDRCPRVVILDDGCLPDPGADLERTLKEIADRSALILLAADVAVPAARLAPAQVVGKPLQSHCLDRALNEALCVLDRKLGSRAFQETTTATTPGSRDDENDELAWLGSLAAMLAHELTSPLDGSMRYLGLLKRHLETDSDLVDYIAEIEHGLGRMARMIRALLAFSRNAMTQRPPRPLELLLEEAEAQVRHHELRDDVRVLVIGSAPPPLVSASLFQVFTNLIRNAFDAMPEGGTLTVRWTPSPCGIEIVFEDEGPGFTEETRRRAFEPFFTTKPFGQGTGLGLPICRRLVQAVGGRIVIDERPGLGARVRLIVPTDGHATPPGGRELEG
ncbi:MAG: ATP-binding protein [Planctomycetota bacterium]